MRRLILHIGKSKTGTSTFQQSVDLNKHLLAANGINIPSFLKDPNHSQLALAFSQNPGVIARGMGIETEENRLDLQKHLGEQFTQYITDGTWLMTSEHIATRLRTGEEIKAMLNFLRNYFDQIDVIAVVRRPDDLAASAYAESIKAGRTWKFDVSYANKARRSYSHSLFAATWRSQLPSNTTFTLRPYLPQRANNDLIDFVLKLAGVNPHLRNSFAPVETLNESMSVEAVQFLRLVNPNFPSGALTNRLRRKLITALTEFKGNKVTLAPEIGQFLVDNDLVFGGLNPRDFMGDALWNEWFALPRVATKSWPELDEALLNKLHDHCKANGVPTERTRVNLIDSLDAVSKVRNKVVRLIRW
ncbi:MAG: hypothetical protein RLZZ508_200 [Actinomycetota bacterium]